MDGLVRPVDFLLPNESIDLKKWAVVACDQFTSQPEYWERLGEFTKGSPSVLNIIYPEVYLADRTEERIEKINKTISEYLSGGVFRQVKDSYILISRDTVTASGRLGLLASIDLEKFDFRPFSKAPVKATEETVLERIPPRLKIRKNAELELPHIILLIDDPDMTVLEPLYAGRDRLEKLYDTELNMSGGRVEGYRVKDTAAVNAALSKLLSPAEQTKKYGYDAGFLFAVGDGNHSLVTAKKHWESIREGLSEEERLNHPARYALAEIENLWSPAIKFEPIHRIIFGNTEGLLAELESAAGGVSKLGVLTAGGRTEIAVSDNSIEAISQIQRFIDKKLKDKAPFEVDYIHGDDYLKEIHKFKGGIALFMPKVKKSELFPYVLKQGVMPKKSFSMGDAEEKRYYLEAKKITK